MYIYINTRYIYGGRHCGESLGSVTSDEDALTQPLLLFCKMGTVPAPTNGTVGGAVKRDFMQSPSAQLMEHRTDKLLF